MSTVAIIQARMGSTRLPGKVMKMLQDRTVIGHVVNRLQASTRLDQIWIATTTLPEDDAVALEAARYGVPVFRGSKDDVLDRYYQTATRAKAMTVVRITSDCPLIDPVVTDELIHFYQTTDCDYASNTLERTFPRGLDAEVFAFDALETAWRHASQPFEREHVTPFLYLHPEQFRLASYVKKENLSHYRLTLDTEEDWVLIRTIYERCHGNGGRIMFEDVKKLLECDPSLIAINADVEQKKLGE